MLRERTLLHLILASGKSICQVRSNSPLIAPVSEICRTLKVTRDRGGPYILTWSIDGNSRRLEVPSSKFRFHERGDVVRATANSKRDGNLQVENWANSIEVWRQILKCDFDSPNSVVLPESGSRVSRVNQIQITGALLLASAVTVTLAQFKTISYVGIPLSFLVPLFWFGVRRTIREVNLVLAVFVITYLIIATSVEPVGLSVLGLLAFRHLSDAILKKLGYLPMICLWTLFLLTEKISVLSALVIMIFEVISGVFAGRERIAITWALIGATTLLFARPDFTVPKADAVVVVGLLLVTLLNLTIHLPLADQEGLQRIWAPIGLLTECLEFGGGGIQVFLIQIVWIAIGLVGASSRTWSGKRHSKAADSRNVVSVPVVIRNRK